MANAYTSNYKLDLYTDNDKPNLRDQYNGAINKIDEELHNNSVNITTANNTANRAYDVASEAKTTATDASKNATTAISTANSATKTANTASSTASSAVTTANSAKEIANAASKTATSAATTANSANGKVDDALVKISDATTKLDAATENFTTNFNKLSGDFTTNFNKLSGDFTTNFNKLSGDITTLKDTKQNRKFSKMLYIGDSWGQGWTGSNHPSSGLAAYLGTALGCETINKSVSAAGYIPNGDSRNFIGQLNSVTDEEKNGVDLVVVQGGINDGPFEYDNIVSAAVSLYNKIIQSYPDAKIAVLNTPLAYGRNFGSSNNSNSIDTPQDMKPYAAINEAVRNCSNPRQIQLIQSSYRWAQSFDQSDSYGGAHLSASGYQKFANIAAMCITNDTEYWPSYYQKISLNSAFGPVRCAYAYEVNGVCGICINATIAEGKTLAINDTICTLDQRFSRARSMFGVGYNTSNSGFYAYDNTYRSNGVCNGVKISQQGGELTSGNWAFINLNWQAGC